MIPQRLLWCFFKVWSLRKHNDIEPVIKNCKEKEIKVAVAADILSLALLKSPGEMGADVVVEAHKIWYTPWLWKATRCLLCN